MHKARASHILVKTEEQAKEILAKIKNGESFSKMAEQFSLCPSKKKGGSLGEFGRGQMVKEFEKAVFDGKKGDLVLCHTQFGWHIIRIEDLRG